MWWLAWALPLLAFVVLLVLLLAKAWRFRPKTQLAAPAAELIFSSQRAVDSLQRLLQLATVSSYRPEEEDEAAFARLPVLLKELFPALHQTCQLHKLGRRGLLFHWPGKNNVKPLVLMAHYDVVPAAANLWRQPPFAGVIAQGHLWGRGALDTKLSFNSILQAAEILLEQGFQPEQDIYLAFGGNEEVMGPDAPAMVDWFENNKIKPAFVLDEGGAIVSGIFPGVKAQCAVIGTGEKGIMQVELVHKSGGGHASTPPARSSLGRLARACLRIEKNPLKRQLTPPIKEMFDTLGRHSSFFYRLIFANLWLFSGILDKVFQKKGGELNALIRTTVAFTQASGSSQTNVMPTRAVLGANLRLISGDSCASVQQELVRLIADPEIEVNTLACQEASPISATDKSPYWQALASSVQAVWPGTLVSPFLMIGASDSRHYCRICDQVYRFSPMVLSDELRASIHGNDERVPLEAIADGVRFYLELIRRI